MKLTEKSYPHPVVGNRDDVTDTSFQASLEMTTDKDYVYIDISITCSSSTINEHILNNNMCYLLHVDCSNTFFRKVYKFSESTYRQEIPIGYLNDLIEVNVFVIATNKINNYKIEGAHQDYGEITFDVNVADIMAVTQTVTFHIDERFDSMKRVSSIMQIVENPKPNPDLPIEIDFSGQKISILMSKSDFREYKLLKSNEILITNIVATIVFPVLLEALRVMKSHEYSNMEDDESPKWVVVLRRKIRELNLKDDDFIVVQKLLELPIKRSLSSAHLLAEVSDL
jgi:hypothetical protein